MASPASKKRRTQVVPVQTNGSTHAANDRWAPPYDPPSKEEKESWQGFSEIESEPALFNHILKAWRVKGVKVQEVFGIDEASISMLSKPVYGLIFLFRYRSDTENDQEATCPDHVWFANQTNDYSCATMSLMNIVNNIPDIELGEELQNFKAFTKDFTPAQRGEAIGNFTFIKNIHNSFARKMDMFNIDLSLQNQFDDRKTKNRTSQTPVKAAKGKKKKSSVITSDDYEEEAGFHFSAYVPIQGELWKLDGLNRQPVKLGQYEGEDWLTAIMPFVEGGMTEYYEGNIEFVLFSLVKDPREELQDRLAQNVRDTRAVQTRLNAVAPDWRLTSENMESSHGENFGPGPDAGLGILESTLQTIEPSEEIQQAILSNDSAQLLRLLLQAQERQWQLRASMEEEVESARDDGRRAGERMHDYAPLIYTWLGMLAEKDGLVRELIEEIG